MLVLSGKEVATKVRSEVQQECTRFKQETGHTPCLAVVLVGDDPASATYVASKGKACEEMGFDHRDYRLPADTTEDYVVNLVEQLNADPLVDGILVQLPLPAHLSEKRITNTIRDDKDVDGLHPINIGRLLLGDPSFVACTPAGVMRILDHYQIETTGKEVVVVGRSNIVGKPMAALLMQKGRDATVTICHSRTADVGEHTRKADILVAAIGKPLAITADMVKEGAVVIDVGINRVEDASRKRGYRLVGDVDYDAVAPLSSAITPVPGGIGPMTIAMLMENTLIAAKMHV
ncbi:MAG: bifunctional methylenetetrahydrofolate dehydrogenase/methenyltetrahydrofolate cyclohydrolase FolD [Spirochaetae bacterium HGW-Spirochaetae-4]|jgi:methylenetetrahydrofolate dehydrogenase (NADP+)/methenyltetrahydrofolate cyclohydrolase|nr:MAG: bifunctional 5,10-methylene-tetrahydrofolate dehydrogenase/5,10-methylene-tetrahydrofolate cyclohydrolase [Spirochaetes bacterium GWC2_52_13]PKL20340.1 MAG: bifunctional methylenetetrahydrofolate dehydrogenase/methenyltetrahydrofolate cyclohydrolase FolD [Spirochaetae bacterium HGW-Spirochaetae-4]HCG64223.1 bifunctional methylenetetrahydrofolate dehydrogenase/methenyltetrahydrofolate cyclohydrolase FolD [Sphaerochaeta sp.]